MQYQHIACLVAMLVLKAFSATDGKRLKGQLAAVGMYAYQHKLKTALGINKH